MQTDAEQSDSVTKCSNDYLFNVYNIYYTLESFTMAFIRNASKMLGLLQNYLKNSITLEFP